jgi:hypothetical protein
VGYGLGRVSWNVAEAEQRPLRVVVIDAWPRAVPEVPREEESTPLPQEVVPPVMEPQAREPESVPPQASPPAEVPKVEETGPARQDPLPSGLDWEQERRNAVQRVLEAEARGRGRITFLPEELFDKPEAEAPNPREKIFDSPRRGRGRSFLTPGQARSRFGNRVAELCNVLTGGALCPEAGPGADFFADIRPAYMESLPVCVETRDPLLNPEGSNEFPTIKCRLVHEDELARGFTDGRE